MKILNIHKKITSDELFDLLQEKLNPLFHEQKQSDLNFIVADKDGAIEISQPEIYEGFLFSIAINGDELWINRSEHYVDDVNSLTLESILNGLFEELAGEKGITFVLEG
jgi:hypothetical protein